MNELRTPHMRPGGVVRTRLIFAPRWVRLLPFALVAVALGAGAAIIVGQMNDRLASAPQDDLAADRFAYRYATEQDT
ncbi:MAG: hypothetical protein H0U16_10715, partial [Actinobacteria bacterium]|nr:hypothetical protein [Actinomycetota bacterium]